MRQEEAAGPPQEAAGPPQEVATIHVVPLQEAEVLTDHTLTPTAPES